MGKLPVVCVARYCGECHLNLTHASTVSPSHVHALIKKPCNLSYFNLHHLVSFSKLELENENKNIKRQFASGRATKKRKHSNKIMQRNPEQSGIKEDKPSKIEKIRLERGENGKTLCEHEI